MSEKPDDNEKRKEEWTPEKINYVFKGVDILASKYLSFRDTNSKHEAELLKATTKHDRRIIAILLTFLGAVIIVMAVLTWLEKVSGEALMFAIGLTIGYIFAIITKFVYGSNVTREDTEE